MVPVNRGHAEVPVPYKQQHRCHRQAQENTELFAFGAGALSTRTKKCPRADCGARSSYRMERVKEACSILKEHSLKRLWKTLLRTGAIMTIPHYINEDRSEMRGIKPGWYAMDDAGKLS